MNTVCSEQFLWVLIYNFKKKIMKKVLIFAAFFALSSCSEDYLNNDNAQLASEEQIQALAESNPEALLSITNGILSGNNVFLNDFNTAGGGNIHDDFGLKSIEFGLDLMGNDVVQVQNHWFGNYYNYNGRTEPNRITDMVWKFYYKVIYNCNSIIRLIPENTSNQQLLYVLGRAKAVRGFSYFNLVRLYGKGAVGIPYYSDDAALTEPGRADYDFVLEKTLEDFDDAYALLGGYVRSNKTEVNKQVVAGFLARYHLEVSGDYSQAANYAVEARSGFALMSNDMISINDANWDGLNKIGNQEWMWGADLNTETSTYYASFFSQAGSLNPGYAGLLGVYKSIDKRLYDLISSTDKRKDWFAAAGNSFGVPEYANLKFYDDTDFEGDYVFMRSAEMYLIEAEALALAGNEAGARQALLGLLSTRDTSYTLSSNTGTALLNEIRVNRRVELWGEGFHFYDLKRWGEGVQRTYTGTNHASFGIQNFPAGDNKFFFQIPILEVNNNEFINPVDQNPL